MLIVGDEKNGVDSSISEIEKIFNITLIWMNSKSNKDSYLYTKKALQDEKSKVKELIEYKPCINELQEKNFYLKSGRLLAVLYILNIKDIRSENIIAIGDTPVILSFQNITSITPISSFFCNEIANAIIDSSVYNIEFLAKQKPILTDEYVACIKDGFQAVYNIVLENKLDLINNIKSDYYLLSSIVSKIQMLSLKDMKRQLSFIDVRFLKKHKYRNNICFSNNELKIELNSKSLLEVVCNIGDYIIERGIIGYRHSSMERTWIDVLEDGSIAAIGNDLYEGNNGIALFLAYLGTISNKKYFLETALEAMRPVIRYIEDIDKNTVPALGAFKGISGIFYTLSKLYKLTGEDNIKELIKSNISILYKLVDYKCIDVMDGSAGIIAILICIYNDIDDTELRNVILELLDIAYKNVMDGVKELENNKECNVGFAYGLSGVIAYLAKLFSMKKDKNIEDDLRYILNLERKSYEKEKDKLKNNWLNGASGILLSRLMLKEAGYSDDLLNDEIDNLIQITTEKGENPDPYYAYGQIGKLEILNYAAKVSKNDYLKNRCINTYNEIIKNILEGTMYENYDYDSEPISFINGLSGIGYSLIQKYDENIVPQILFFS